MSLCRAIVALQQRRSIADVVQVPSVFLANVGNGLAYSGCSQCKKGLWEMQPTCQCADFQEQLYWKASLTLTDGTAQVSVTAFDALGELSSFWDDEHKPFAPMLFAEDSTEAAELMMTVAAGALFFLES